MEKAAGFMIIVGSLIAIGIVLSFYGSQIIIEDLNPTESNVKTGNSLEITAILDPEISQTGVYVIQTINFNKDSIFVKIVDPTGSQIVSKSIDRESFEGKFDIDYDGQYSLVVENSGEETQIIGVIGHMPDKAKLSIGIIGSYTLIVGLIGIVGVGVYAVKSKRKKKSS